MNTLFDRLKKALPFVGSRPVTEDDLHDFCETRGVDVVFAHEIRHGLYVRTEMGTDHIFLNSMLYGHSLVYVFAHEVAHMILHVPTRSRRAAKMQFSGDLSRRMHDEAETAAALMMYPLAKIERSLIEARSIGNPHINQLLARRVNYLNLYNE